MDLVKSKLLWIAKNDHGTTSFGGNTRGRILETRTRRRQRSKAISKSTKDSSVWVLRGHRHCTEQAVKFIAIRNYMELLKEPAGSSSYGR